jgi:hypothetical protein
MLEVDESRTNRTMRRDAHHMTASKRLENLIDPLHIFHLIYSFDCFARLVYLT